MSTARKPKHDTLVRRLSSILLRLNQGEGLDPRALALEFGTTLRTLQRDLNERLAYLPLERIEGKYRLNPAFLGKLTAADIERFAALAGVQGLFPSLGEDFLRQLFTDRTQVSLLVRGHHYEDLSGFEPQFRLLEQCVAKSLMCSFRYDKGTEEKVYADVHPYRLVNHKGIWYLIALDGQKIKSFSFTRISAAFASTQRFTRDSRVDAKIEQDEGIWSGSAHTEVVISVSAAVAPYFKRRNLIANQRIHQELSDGSLQLVAVVGHPNQVLPHVRYWIPHLRVISPPEWQRQLEGELAGYISNDPKT